MGFRKDVEHCWIKCNRWILCLIIFFIVACQSLADAPMGHGVYHTVQKGQTLFQIAEVYNQDVKLLQRINDLSNPDQINVGLRLWVPSARRVLSLPKTTSKGNLTPNFKLLKKVFPSKKSHKISKKVGKEILDWPLKGGVLNSKFGNRKGRHHDGIDIAASLGSEVFAAGSGKVVFSGDGPKGYGNMVIIKLSVHLMTVYAHNSINHVGRSMKVRKGQKIALVGSTGRSSGPHLHFEVRNNTQPVNPLFYLPSLEAGKVAHGVR